MSDLMKKELSININTNVDTEPIKKARSEIQSFRQECETNSIKLGIDKKSLQIDTRGFYKAINAAKALEDQLHVVQKTAPKMMGALEDADAGFGFANNFREELKDAMIAFDDGSIVNGFDNIVSKISEGFKVVAVDLGNRSEYLKAQITEIIGELKSVGAVESNAFGVFGFSRDNMDNDQLKNRIVLIENLLQAQKELEIFKGKKFKHDEAPSGMSSSALEGQIRVLKSKADELEKYNLRTTEQLKRRVELIQEANATWQWDDDDHSNAKDNIKDDGEYESAIASLEWYINQRKETIQKLKDNEGELFSVDGITEYVNNANEQIERFQRQKLELQNLRNAKTDDPQIPIIGDFSGVISQLEEIKNAINGIREAFEPLTTALSSEDSALSAMVKSNITDLDLLNSKVNEAFAEANRKAAESGKVTEDVIKGAADSIEAEADAVEKASDSFDKVSTTFDKENKPLYKTETKSKVGQDSVDTTTKNYIYKDDKDDEGWKLSTETIVKDFKKRASELKKESDKIALAQKTVDKFVSQFESKTAGQASKIKGFDGENGLKGFTIQSLDDIETATQKMIELDAEYNKLTKSFRQGTKSMNPFVNAITGIGEMENKIQEVEIAFNNLNTKPEKLSKEVDNLIPLFSDMMSFISEDENGNRTITDIYGMAEAYGKLNAALRQVSSNIKIQKQIDASKTKDVNFGLDLEKQFSAMSKQQAQWEKNGQLTDELRQKINGMFDSLANVANSSELTTWKRQWSILKDEVMETKYQIEAAKKAQEPANKKEAQDKAYWDGRFKESVDGLITPEKRPELEQIKASMLQQAAATEESVVEQYDTIMTIITQKNNALQKLMSAKGPEEQKYWQDQYSAWFGAWNALNKDVLSKFFEDAGNQAILGAEKIDKFNAAVEQSKILAAKNKDDAKNKADKEADKQQKDLGTSVNNAYKEYTQAIIKLKKLQADTSGKDHTNAIRATIQDIQDAKKKLSELGVDVNKIAENTVLTERQTNELLEQRIAYKKELRHIDSQAADAETDKKNKETDKQQKKVQKKDYDNILDSVKQLYEAQTNLHKMNIDLSGNVHVAEREKEIARVKELSKLLKETYGIDIKDLSGSLDRSVILTQEQKNDLLQQECEYRRNIVNLTAEAADKAATAENKEAQKYGKTVYNRESKYRDIIDSNIRSIGEENLNDDFLKKIEQYKDAYKKFEDLRNAITKEPIASDELKNQFQDATLEVEKLRKEVMGVFKESQKFENIPKDSLLGVKTFDASKIKDVKAALIEYAAEITSGQLKITGFNASNTEMYGVLDKGAGAVERVTVALQSGTNTLYAYQSGTQQISDSWQKLGDKLKSGVKNIIGQYFGFHEALQALRQGFTYVKEIDLAMTELRKVTDETDSTYNNFLKTASNVSGEIGSTVSDFTDATAAFARLGYSIDEATSMAETAIVYKNVADGLDTVEESTESIISTMMAFGINANDTMSIVDKFNAVGNSFAITSAGIGDALQRSASALYSAGNSIDESVALVTAANSVIQNPEQVGTALKTLALRLRGAKVELEDAGLETDNMAESTSQLQEKLLALTHGKVDIMLDED